MLSFDTVLVDESIAPRERIVRATYRLLADGGLGAVSTRAVTAAAGVQVPTIYRQFGDMNGLLTEVANYGFETYLANKMAMNDTADPVADLSHGWDLHIEFGLAEPAVYALMYGDPRPGPRPVAVRRARQMLRVIVQRIAQTGRLQVSVDQAVDMVDAAGVGVVLHLFEFPPQTRDLALSTAVRDAVLESIVTSADPTDLQPSAGSQLLHQRAVSLRAVLDTATDRLSAGEMHLLNEWLDRLSAPPPAPVRRPDTLSPNRAADPNATSQA